MLPHSRRAPTASSPAARRRASPSPGLGSTNLLTGLYDAKLDQSPVIAISGQVPSKVLGRGAFQDLDLSAVFKDVAITSTTVQSGSDHAELAAIAVKHARDGRGVAHLVLPDEVQALPSHAPAASPDGRYSDRLVRPDEAALERAAKLVIDAKRPVIIVGHGARGAEAEVTGLAERLHAPVLTTFKAKGLVPDTHPLGAGVLGRSGTPVASWLMNESDLLVVVGASFSNHTGIAPYKPIVQIDDNPTSIGRFDAVTANVLGDAAIVVAALTQAVADADPEDQRPDVAERWAIWRAEKARRAADDRGAGVSAAAVFAALSEHLPEDAVVAVDVGNHAYSLGRYLESKGQPVLMSGYLGSIGFGYPAAIGAWAADPDRPVVAVTGDGGFGQYATELTTAVKYGIPIKHVLLNNNALGKISKEQLAADYPVWHTSLAQPRLGGLRRAVRRDRHQGHQPRPARRRHDHPVRDHRTGAALHRAGRRAALTHPSLARTQPNEEIAVTEPTATPTEDQLCRPQGAVHQLHAEAIARAEQHPGAGRHQPPHHGGPRRAGRCRAGHRPRHRHRRVARHDRARLGDRRLAGDLREGQGRRHPGARRTDLARRQQLDHEAGARAAVRRLAPAQRPRASTSTTAGSAAA